MMRLLIALMASWLLAPMAHADAGLVRPPKGVLGKARDYGETRYVGAQVVCHRVQNPLGGWRYVRFPIGVSVTTWSMWYPLDVYPYSPDAVCR